MPYIPHAALLRRPGGGGVQAQIAPSLRRPAFQTIVRSVSPTAACAVASSKAALPRSGRGGTLAGQMHAGSPPDPVVVPAVTTAIARPIRALPETINKATRALAAALEDEKVQELGRSICAEENGYFDSKNIFHSKSHTEAERWFMDPSRFQAAIVFNGTDVTGDLEPVIGRSEVLPLRRASPGLQQEALSAARERSSRRGAVRQASGGDMWFISSWGHATRDSSEESADMFDSDSTEHDPDSPCGRRRRSFQDALEAERAERAGSSSSSGILADCSSEENVEVGSSCGPDCSSPPPATLPSLASPPSPTPPLSPTPPVRVVRVADARVPLVTKDLSFDDNRPIGVDAAIPAFLRRARAAPPGPGSGPGHGQGHAPQDEE